MNEMQCDEDKIEYIQGKIQAPPSNHAIGMENSKSNPPPKEAKRVASRGLVKISANYLSMSIYLISISPFST
jgi:hypothetical protein